jgi:hypothetical protein
LKYFETDGKNTLKEERKQMLMIQPKKEKECLKELKMAKNAQKKK